MKRLQGIEGILWVALVAFLSILSTSSPALSYTITIVQYAIVYYCIVSGKLFQAFIFFMLFTSATLEIDFYVYYGGRAPFNRWSFFNPNLAYRFTAIVLMVLILSKYGRQLRIILHNKALKRIYYWMILLLTTGCISVILGLVLGDNVVSIPAVFNKVLGFLVYFSIIIITIIFASDKLHRNNLAEISVAVLSGVTLSAIVSILLGFRGYYGTEYETMQAPMLVGFAPCLLAFIKNPKLINRIAYLTLSVLIIILAFNAPSVIGSKWYLIIVASIVFFTYRTVPNLNPIVIVLLAVALIFIVPTIGMMLSDIMSEHAYNNWKFNQAIKTLDIFSYNTISDWFLDQDESARFRIDEPINIAIEYLNHPLYALFGKGIGGTTQHYTVFTDWSMGAAFTDSQIKIGHFYDMHETFAVLFLRHGFLGIVFFIDMLILTIKHMKYSPFGMWGFLWFFFYWAFGFSFMLGIIPFILALTTTTNEISFIKKS